MRRTLGLLVGSGLVAAAVWVCAPTATAAAPAGFIRKDFTNLNGLEVHVLKHVASGACFVVVVTGVYGGQHATFEPTTPEVCG